jgi:hypothetical protein
MGRHWRTGALAVVLVTCTAVPVTNAIARATKAASLPYYLPPAVVGAWNRNVTEANWSKYIFSKATHSGFPVGVWTIVVSKGGGVKVYTPGGYRPGCISHAQGDRRQAVRATRSTLRRRLEAHETLEAGRGRAFDAPPEANGCTTPASITTTDDIHVIRDLDQLAETTTGVLSDAPESFPTP